MILGRINDNMPSPKSQDTIVLKHRDYDSIHSSFSYVIHSRNSRSFNSLYDKFWSPAGALQPTFQTSLTKFQHRLPDKSDHTALDENSKQNQSEIYSVVKYKKAINCITGMALNEKSRILGASSSATTSGGAFMTSQVCHHLHRDFSCPSLVKTRTFRHDQ